MNPLTLYHFSPEPFYFTPERYKARVETSFKPTGLWLSDESEEGWSKWCESEQFRLEQLKYITEVKIKPEILQITSIEAFEEFEKKYAEAMYGGIRKMYINWGRVMAEHKGIVITPYFWEKRLSSFWYYPWDCASGCVWDWNLIESVSESRLFKPELLTKGE